MPKDGRVEYGFRIKYGMTGENGEWLIGEWGVLDVLSFVICADEFALLGTSTGSGRPKS
jgi:hypothetical protein